MQEEENEMETPIEQNAETQPMEPEQDDAVSIDLGKHRTRTLAGEMEQALERGRRPLPRARWQGLPELSPTPERRDGTPAHPRSWKPCWKTWAPILDNFSAHLQAAEATRELEPLRGRGQEHDLTARLKRSSRGSISTPSRAVGKAV